MNLKNFLALTLLSSFSFAMLPQEAPLEKEALSPIYSVDYVKEIGSYLPNNDLLSLRLVSKNVFEALESCWIEREESELLTYCCPNSYVLGLLSTRQKLNYFAMNVQLSQDFIDLLFTTRSSQEEYLNATKEFCLKAVTLTHEAFPEIHENAKNHYTVLEALKGSYPTSNLGSLAASFMEYSFCYVDRAIVSEYNGYSSGAYGYEQNEVLATEAFEKFIKKYPSKDSGVLYFLKYDLNTMLHKKEDAENFLQLSIEAGNQNAMSTKIRNSKDTPQELELTKKFIEKYGFNEFYTVYEYYKNIDVTKAQEFLEERFNAGDIYAFESKFLNGLDLTSYLTPSSPFYSKAVEKIIGKSIFQKKTSEEIKNLIKKYSYVDFYPHLLGYSHPKKDFQLGKTKDMDGLALAEKWFGKGEQK
ncbi:MAG TPA: hypothetical protein VI959_01990 [Alphaproteobacteria bacterium]|nr:hypothetical protein [Alphaproteobacteria bacterium]